MEIFFLAHHHLPLYYQFWWDGTSVFQGPQWHRNCNKNARKKSPDCLASIELRMPSSASGVFFSPVLEKHATDLPNSKCTGIWSLCLRLPFRSSWQGEDATKTSIFTLVEPESQTKSCERGGELQSPCPAFYTQPDMQRKNKPQPQNKAKQGNQSKNRCSLTFPHCPNIFSPPVWREPQKLLLYRNVNVFCPSHLQVFARLVLLESLNLIKKRLGVSSLQILNAPSLSRFRGGIRNDQIIKYKKTLQNVRHLRP